MRVTALLVHSTVMCAYKEPAFQELPVITNYFSFSNLKQRTCLLYVYKEPRAHFHGPEEFVISGFYCIQVVLDRMQCAKHQYAVRKMLYCTQALKLHLKVASFNKKRQANVTVISSQITQANVTVISSLITQANVTVISS